MIDSYQFMRLPIQIRLDYALDILGEEIFGDTGTYYGQPTPNKVLFKIEEIRDFKDGEQKTVVKEYIKERKSIRSPLKDLERIEKAYQRTREEIRSEQEFKLEYFKARQMDRARREIAKLLKRAGFHQSFVEE